jgi:hypothetical protein
MTVSTRIVQHVLGQGFELLVDQEQPTLDDDPVPPIVLRDAALGRDILDLSHPHIQAWLAQLGYELTGKVPSRAALTLALITLEGIARYGTSQR